MEDQDQITNEVQPTQPVVVQKETRLNAEQCLNITRAAGADRTYDATDKSRYYNLKYKLYHYDNIGFTIPLGDRFHDLFDNDELGEVRLQRTDKGYDYINAKSQKGIWNAHSSHVKREAFTVEHVREKYSMDDYNKMA